MKLLPLLVVALLAASCAQAPSAEPPRPQLRVIVPSSMQLPPNFVEDFSQRNDVDVVEIRVSDGETAVDTLNANIEFPAADVAIGLDLLALAEASETRAFATYESPATANVDPRLLNQSEGIATPVSYRDYCVLYDQSQLEKLEIDTPSGLTELSDVRFADQITFPDPATSRDGQLLLLAVVAAYGSDGGVAIFKAETELTRPAWSQGVSQSFFEIFISPARPTGPAITWGTSGMLALEERLIPFESTEEFVLRIGTEGCLRVGDFAAVAQNAKNPELARAFIDALLEPEAQLALLDLRGTLPAVQGLTLPPEYARVPRPPITRVITASEVAENLSRWTSEWAQPVVIVLDTSETTTTQGTPEGDS